MRLKKFLALAMSTILAAGAMSAVTLQGATSTQTTVYGKVTAVSGKKVTLALGTISQPTAKPSKPTSSKPTSSGTKGTPPAGGAGNSVALKLNGKKQTITISNTSIIAKDAGPGGQPTGSAPSSKPAATSSKSSSKPAQPTIKASLSEIKVGCILKVVYTTSSKSLVSIVIMNSDQGKSTSSKS
jgi:hypothetical protein